MDRLIRLFCPQDWRERRRSVNSTRRTPHYSSLRASTVDWPIDQIETLRIRGSSPKSNNLCGRAFLRASRRHDDASVQRIENRRQEISFVSCRRPIGHEPPVIRKAKHRQWAAAFTMHLPLDVNGFCTLE